MRWILKQTVPSIVADHPFSPFTQALMISRGIPLERASTFLSPRMEDLASPFRIPGMDAAVERVARALKGGERILVHGDYDADGVVSTALLVRNLRRLGGEVLAYIPDRFAEGYGLSAEGIRYAHEQGVSLIITVDCGITAVEEVAQARELGMDVVVTDHHLPQEVLPPAVAVVNPRLMEGGEELAGVGVVFKLLDALYGYLDEDKTPLYWDLDLVALGTVADLMPLVGENRVLVHYGLKVLSQTRKAGLKALQEVARLRGRSLSPWHISFILGPRLNVAGRLRHARIALELLTTRDGATALKLAQLLDQENRRRQVLERKITEEAVARIEANGIREHPVMVVDGEGWHEGVIGIVASRLVERYERPAVVIAVEDGWGKGSGRSVPGFHLFEALYAHRHLLDAFGGHRMAAGLRIRAERIPHLREALVRYVDRYAVDPPQPEVEVDFVLPDPAWLADPRLPEEFERLQPFGMGHPYPTFVLPGARVVQRSRPTRKGLRFLLLYKGKSFVAERFARGAPWEQTPPGEVVDALVRLKGFQGGHPHLEVLDLRRGGAG